MSFWDPSSILPLILDEPASPVVREIMKSQEATTVWWGTLVECHSALERRSRTGLMSGDQKRQALQLLRQLARAWHETLPTTLLRERALRLLALHDLRAADSLQLAAALVWSGEQPHGRAFVCLDSRLRASAEHEGFTVLPEAFI
ncbi:MAG: type II toxin-antitoxin system VapC family toxin [Acidobacteriota bacterium]